MDSPARRANLLRRGWRQVVPGDYQRLRLWINATNFGTRYCYPPEARLAAVA